MQSVRQQFVWPLFCPRRVQHGAQASEPAAYYRPIRVCAKLRGSNIGLKISGS